MTAEDRFRRNVSYVAAVSGIICGAVGFAFWPSPVGVICGGAAGVVLILFAVGVSTLF